MSLVFFGDLKRKQKELKVLYATERWDHNKEKKCALMPFKFFFYIFFLCSLVSAEEKLQMTK
jgi:hypothetical protein